VAQAVDDQGIFNMTEIGALIQIIEMQDERIEMLEEKIDVMVSGRAADAALMAELVPLLTILDNRIREVQGGLKAMQSRDFKKLGGVDYDVMAKLIKRGIDGNPVR
jgi:hypothetical protein